MIFKKRHTDPNPSLCAFVFDLRDSPGAATFKGRWLNRRVAPTVCLRTLRSVVLIRYFCLRVSAFPFGAAQTAVSPGTIIRPIFSYCKYIMRFPKRQVGFHAFLLKIEHTLCLYPPLLQKGHTAVAMWPLPMESLTLSQANQRWQKRARTAAI